MRALDSINTGQWSNIPPCIVQSINVLVEQSRIQGQQADLMRSQLSDLTIKVSAKNQKFESHLDEINQTLSNLKASTSNHWQELQHSLLTSQDSVDRLKGHAQNNYDELKSRLTHIVSTNKKQVKQNDKKLEAMSKQIAENIQVSTEKAKVELEENIKEFVNKYVVFAGGIEEVVENIKNKQTLFDDKIKVLDEKLGVQMSLLIMNENSLNGLREMSSKLVFRNQKHKTTLKNLSNKVENLVNQSDSENSTPRSAPSPTIHINPIRDRIDKLEKAFGAYEIESKLAQEKLYYNNFQENKKLEDSLKDWTRSEVCEKINSFLGESKKKLDWIPNGSESMKGMSVTEARIFLIESRIRQEEKSRILDIQKLEDEIKFFKRPRSEPGHKKSKTACTPVDDKVVNFQKVKVVHKRPSSSLGYREGGALGKAGLREKFRIKVNELFL